jgi:hypothetical protein
MYMPTGVIHHDDLIWCDLKGDTATKRYIANVKGREKAFNLVKAIRSKLGFLMTLHCIDGIDRAYAFDADYRVASLNLLDRIKRDQVRVFAYGWLTAMTTEAKDVRNTPIRAKETCPMTGADCNELQASCGEGQYCWLKG